MKERMIPTKDLKTAVRVVGMAASSTFEGVKPYAREYARKKVVKVLKRKGLL